MKIVVPATCNNIFPGLENLGLALSLFDQYSFELSNKWELLGFMRLDNIQDSLIVQAIEKVYQKANVTITPYRINFIQCIPEGKSLGSKAAAVIAGIKAANKSLNNMFSNNELLEIASLFSISLGNIVPGFFGSMFNSYKVNNEINYTKHSISEQLTFSIALPNFPINKKKMQESIVSKIEYNNISPLLSRVFNMANILTQGDLKALYNLMDEALKYNKLLSFLNEKEKFMMFSKHYQIPFWINSNSSTLVFISKQSIIKLLNEIPLKQSWQFIELKGNATGAIITE